MRRYLALFSVVVTAVVFLGLGGGTAAADPQPAGCPAFGAYMGVAAPWSGQNRQPLGQVIRELTPFDNTLAPIKQNVCG